jgi:hypothetical protein
MSLMPTQSSPVVRASTGASAHRGAEQSKYDVWLMPFEGDGAEQSKYDVWLMPFEV